jgi:CelD/BcsL family acetyltransferase involved in cellulose biosynthesis
MHGTAFDPALASFSPGRLLMLHVLEKCIGEKRKIYDFLQNEQEFKRQMATHESSFWDWIVFPRSLRGGVLLLVVRTLHCVSEWKRRRAKKNEARSAPPSVGESSSE